MLQRPAPRLILASASASRRALLAAAGLAFDVQPARVDEAEVKRAARADGASAEAAALLLAELKAREVARHAPDAVVIGADQILLCGEAWLDKPDSVAAAREQLRRLRGQPHVLATAVLCLQGERRLWHHIARPRLVMRRFSEVFLDDYLAAQGEEVTTTVGAYRLEALGIHLFEQVEGEQSAILGLPMLPLLEFLRQFGVLAA